MCVYIYIYIHTHIYYRSSVHQSCTSKGIVRQGTGNPMFQHCPVLFPYLHTSETLTQRPPGSRRREGEGEGERGREGEGQRERERERERSFLAECLLRHALRLPAADAVRHGSAGHLPAAGRVAIYIYIYI